MQHETKIKRVKKNSKISWFFYIRVWYNGKVEKWGEGFEKQLSQNERFPKPIKREDAAKVSKGRPFSSFALWSRLQVRNPAKQLPKTKKEHFLQSK